MIRPSVHDFLRSCDQLIDGLRHGERFSDLELLLLRNHLMQLEMQWRMWEGQHIQPSGSDDRQTVSNPDSGYLA